MISLGIADGIVGEKPYELSPDVFHKAALLRDSQHGYDSIQPLFDNLAAVRKETQEHIEQCSKLIFGDADPESSKGLLSDARSSIAEDLAAVNDSFRVALTFDNRVEQIWHQIRPQLELLVGPADNIRASLPQAV